MDDQCVQGGEFVYEGRGEAAIVAIVALLSIKTSTHFLPRACACVRTLSLSRLMRWCTERAMKSSCNCGLRSVSDKWSTISLYHILIYIESYLY